MSLWPTGRFTSPEGRGKERGFSLIELAIVLVILGLLVGGIMSGQSLIRAAELRSITTEQQRYLAAISSFRDKYFSLPGDMTNATAFWGAAATCPGVAATAAAGVCNGNGDGQIRWDAASSNEMYGFWEHLAAAGLIEGAYTGNANSTTASDQAAVIGGNVPRSKVGNAGWNAIQVGNRAIADTSFYEGNYGNVFYFGTGTQVSTAILKPEEAWNIDTKMDDGRPALGSVTSFEWQGYVGTTGCGDLAASNSAALTGSNYALTNTGNNCALIFKTGY